MSKVMLVEDDNNLREIYEARLQAEGYTIVTAHDGEEALVVAKAEQPDLIISDVMMPKISGFEMLDILRNTEGMQDVKVIMLTALGQSDDQQRADRLGADSYLVKSQVTLEDIVKVASRLLGGEEATASEAPAAAPTPEIATTPVAAEEPVATPVVTPVAPEPVVTPVAEPPTVVAADPTPAAAVPSPSPAPAPEPVAVSPVPAPASEPVKPSVAAPTAPAPAPAPAPTEEPKATEQQLFTPPVAPPVEPTTDEEFIKTIGASSEPTPVAAAQPVAEEAAVVEAQIANFANTPTAPPIEVIPSEPAASARAAAPEAPEAATAPAETTLPPSPTEQFVATAPPDLTTAVPAPAPRPQSAGNDDVLATALESLTGEAPAPAPAEAPESYADTLPKTDSSTARGGNRVITPLNMPPKPDINTLLAIEEAKDIINPEVTNLPTTPPQQNKPTIDPNSIAL